MADIHGWDEPVIELLEKVNFDYENDKLILLGDLCDRGQRTWEVIEHLLKVKNIIFIDGNHDHCFRQYLLGNKDYMDWYGGMGKNTIKSYKSHNWENIKKHKEFMNNCVSHHIENNICFVHGGFDRYKLIKDQHKTTLNHDRQLMNDVMNGSEDKLYNIDGFDKIFIGHTPTMHWNVGDEKLNEKLKYKFVLSIDNPNYLPIIKSNVYNLDTGCGKKGPLTIYNVYEDVYHQSSKKY